MQKLLPAVGSDGITEQRIVLTASQPVMAACLLVSVAVLGGPLLDEPVEALMSARVHTCRGADDVESLMSAMTDRRIRHVPVVDDDGLLAGIVSIGDVVKATIDNLQRDRDELVSHIQAR